MPEIAITDHQLDDCAYEINLLGKQIAHRLLDLGKWCVKARDLLAQRRDGSFESWVQANCNISLGYCYASIRVWERFGDCDDLKIDARALLLLASHNVSDEVREKAIELAESGEPVTAAKAKEMIDEHRLDVDRPATAEAGEDTDSEPDDDDEPDDEPPAEDDAHDDSEDDTVHEPAPVKAKASGPVEPNVIGHAIGVIKETIDEQIEGLNPYEVNAVLCRVDEWIAVQMHERGL